MDPAPLDIRRSLSSFFADIEASHLRGLISDDQYAII
jgi:hypothetical protein